MEHNQKELLTRIVSLQKHIKPDEDGGPAYNPKYDQGNPELMRILIRLVSFRLHSTLASLTQLIQSSIMACDISIGLTSRCIISDFLSLYYIYSHKMQDDWEAAICNLFDDDLSKTGKSSKLYVKHGLMEQEVVDKIEKKRTVSGTPQFEIEAYFNNNPGAKRTQFPTASAIMKDVFDRGLPLHGAIMHDAYDLYLIYSKYEHIGWTYYEWLRFRTKDILIKNLHVVLDTTVVLIHTCHVMANDEERTYKILSLYDQVIEEYRIKP